MLSEDEAIFGSLFVNSDMCSVCGGKCCQRCACNNIPSDFDNDILLMQEALESGNYTIDFARKTPYSFVTLPSGYLTLNIPRIIESYDETLYIRPRNQGRPIVDIIHTEDIEGPCVFWSSEKGCNLSYKERPMLGRTLIPSLYGLNCQYPFNSRDLLTKSWKPYNLELFELAKKHFDRTWHLYQQFGFIL